MRTIFTAVLVVAAIAIGVVAVGAALLWLSQERLVFQPPAPPYPESTRVRRLDYVASDGQPLFAWVVGDSGSSDGVVIVFHGNADLAGWQIPWAQEVTRRIGRVVLLPEYRGYGGLPGAPTYTGSALDAQAAYSVARDSLRFHPGRIALFGHSLGSAIAAELAHRVDVEVLVLQAPFTSAREMARLIAARPFLVVWRWITRFHYDTEKLVRTLSPRVWVAHGAADQIIPVEMGQRVFATARARGELLVVDGAGHNDLAARAPELYWPWLTRALTSPGDNR